MSKISLISGSANKELAKEISSHLGIPLTPIEIKRFKDGETYIHIEESVRGSVVFLIQPTSPPTNDNLVELLLIVDALRRASAKEINAIIPYFGYARQDRKSLPREPISAKLVANLITAAGVDRVITFDLHVDQIQGFFDIPLDNLEALPLIADYILDKDLNDVVVVSPDAGGAKRTRRLAKLLEMPLAIIDKRRPKHGEAKVLNIIGEVKGKTAILVDDMIDSAGTVQKASQVLIEKGASEVLICATHPLLSPPAMDRIKDEAIKEVIVTNTLAIPIEKKSPKIKVLSVAKLLAESINRIYKGEPMGVLFDSFYKKLEEKRHR